MMKGYFQYNTEPSLQNAEWRSFTCAKFQRKIFNSVVVRVRQTFQFFRQNNWFLKNKRAFFKFLFGILYYLIKAKKVVLFPEIGRVKIAECVEYMYFVSNKKTYRSKSKRN